MSIATDTKIYTVEKDCIIKVTPIAFGDNYIATFFSYLAINSAYNSSNSSDFLELFWYNANGMFRGCSGLDGDVYKKILTNPILSTAPIGYDFPISHTFAVEEEDYFMLHMNSVQTGYAGGVGFEFYFDLFY